MLTFRRPGTPRALDADGQTYDWLWTPHQGEGPAAPWGGPSRQPQKPIGWVPDFGVPTDCFTFELWLLPAQALRSEEYGLVHCACNVAGAAWDLSFTRHLRPRLRWHDRDSQTQTLVGDSLIDLLEPAQWLHLAVVHHGDGSDPAEPTPAFARWDLYVTPAGEAWPRLMVHESGERCLMHSAAGCVHLLPGPFAFAQAACGAHAKLPNEFATLGQSPPTDVTFSGEFPGGSSHAPVSLGRRQVAVGCRPDLGDANYWHCSHVTLADPADTTPLDLTVLAAPQGQAMLNCLFQSVDGEQWDRLPGGWFANDTAHSAQGFLRLAVPADAPSFYLAAAPPYGLRHVDRLLADVGEHPWAEVLELGETTRHRPIRGLRLTRPDVPAAQKGLLYLQAGQHSPLEQSVGRVLDSLARTLLTDERWAKLLGAVEIHLVPLINIDSAELGEAALTQHKLNPNRYWLGRTIAETAGITAHLDELSQRPTSLRLAVDLHAHGFRPNHVSLYLGERVAEALCRPGWAVDTKRWLGALEKHTGIAQADGVEMNEGFIHFAPALAVKHGWPATTLSFSYNTWRELDGTIHPVTQASLELCGTRLAGALEAYALGR